MSLALREDERRDYTIGLSVVKLVREMVMFSADAIKWNGRYRSGAEAAFESPRDFLVRAGAASARAGTGARHRDGLAATPISDRARLRVIGVDISEVGVRRAQGRWPPLMARYLISALSLAACAFDVILNFYYCQRDLWPQYRSMLKPGGVLIMETLTLETLRTRPDYNPAYLLQPDELCHAFAAWEVLVYHEGWIEMGIMRRAPWRAWWRSARCDT